MQTGTRVNPAAIRQGDSIAVRSHEALDEDGNEIIIVSQTSKIKDASFCPTQPELFHLNGVCHDTRFTSVIRVN